VYGLFSSIQRLQKGMDCCTEGSKTEGEESLVFLIDGEGGNQISATTSRWTPSFPNAGSWYMGYGDRFLVVGWD
jgi:hypothetical protein